MSPDEEPLPDPIDAYLDASGLPIHLPMGVTADGSGPVGDHDPDLAGYVCWCNDPTCGWNRAFRRLTEILTTDTHPPLHLPRGLTETPDGELIGREHNIEWVCGCGHTRSDHTVDEGCQVLVDEAGPCWCTTTPLELDQERQQFNSAHVHDDHGQLDRSLCVVCGSAYIECVGCGVYLCDCTRGTKRNT